MAVTEQAHTPGSDASPTTSIGTGIRRLLRAQFSVIDNECSMARDQFAAERNFLSWVKLAMAVVGSGTIIFRDFNKHISGYTRLADISTLYFFALAMLLLVVSTFYVWDTQHSLATYKRPIRVFHPLFLQVFGCLGAISLIFVLALSYRSYLIQV